MMSSATLTPAGKTFLTSGMVYAVAEGRQKLTVAIWIQKFPQHLQVQLT
jgi:hypothetical protein